MTKNAPIIINRVANGFTVNETSTPSNTMLNMVTDVYVFNNMSDLFRWIETEHFTAAKADPEWRTHHGQNRS